MILDSILNDDNIKKPSEIPSSDNKPLTANDIITLFKSFLQTKCDSKKGLIKTWSISEELSSAELEDILKYADEIKSDTFEDAANEYISDDYINILESLSDKLIIEFYDSIGLKATSDIPHFGKHLVDNIKTKIDIYKQLIEKAKTTRKLADNEKLLSDLSDEDIKNLKMTLNSLVTLITYKRNEVIDVQNIEAWLKHTLKL